MLAAVQQIGQIHHSKDAHVHDSTLAFNSAFSADEARVSGRRSEAVEDRRQQDQVRNAGFIFKCFKDDARRRARPLADQDQAGDLQPSAGQCIPKLAICDSRNAACWDVRKDDFPATSPFIRIAGSFQLRILAAGEAPRDAVPPVDGVHLVLSLQEEQPILWSFVRVDRQILDPATQVLFMDDLAIFARECDERIQRV